MANGFIQFIQSSSLGGQDVAHLNGACYCVQEYDTVGCEFYSKKCAANL